MLTFLCQKLVSNITNFATDEGWLYVAAINDLLGGRKIGLSMSTMMPQSFQGMIASMESRKASRFVDGDDWHIQFH